MPEKNDQMCYKLKAKNTWMYLDASKGNIKLSFLFLYLILI